MPSDPEKPQAQGARSALPEMHWFTTNYIVPEDRLRFACTLKGGDTDVFWLTRRLADPLASKLLEWLDGTVKEEFPDLAHRMAQRSATSRKPKPPAQTIPDAPGWLVRSVSIKAAGKGLLLIFKGDEGHAACVRFDAEHLRRWLRVLHAQFVRSGWPLDIWPDWIADAAKKEPPAQSGMLH